MHEDIGAREQFGTRTGEDIALLPLDRDPYALQLLEGVRDAAAAHGSFGLLGELS